MDSNFSVFAKRIALGFLLLAVFVIAGIGVYYLFKEGEGRKDKVSLPRVGVINRGGGVSFDNFTKGALAGLKEFGYREGTNVEILLRDGQGDEAKNNEFVAELLNYGVDALVVMGKEPMAHALKLTKESGKKTPVLTVLGSPLDHGYVQSMESSGTNLTGIAHTNIELTPKRIEILKELVPSVKKLAMFYDEGCGPTKRYRPLGRQVAAGFGIEMKEFSFKSPSKDEVKNKLEEVLSKEKFDAVLFYPHGTLFSKADLFAAAAKKFRLPIIMPEEANLEGGAALASYGADYFDMGRSLSRLVDKVLRGVPPEEIPFEPPRKIVYVISLKNAEFLNIVIPQESLRRAERVISK